MTKTKIPTLQDAMMTHYKRYKNGQESAEQYLRLLKQCIAILGNKKISQITSKDVTKLIDGVITNKGIHLAKGGK